jgi:hypothetical protein
MKVILREDTSGVSEVIGTILILSMTVVLFSVIIIWVGNIPTPVAQSRLDLRSELDPIYNAAGVETGVNITLVHQGGEPIQPVPTVIYVTSQRGANPPQTSIFTLHKYVQALGNGLLDGRDSVWDIGERWNYNTPALRSSDAITVTVVDISKSQVVWSAPMNAPQGTRPPVFIDKWTDGVCATDAIDPVQAQLGFCLFAKVTDPDGDLNPNSVYATITTWYGSGTVCELPMKMHDDGVAPDLAAGDTVFSLGANACVNPPYPALSWAGSIILLNATDMRGHQTTTRLVLDVVQQTGGGGSTTTIPSALWQYIGYIQIRTGEVWVSNLQNPYTTATTVQPYRVTKDQLNGNGGPLFHFKMANHGNTTIFLDGWTMAYFKSSQSAGGFPLFVVAPCDGTRPASPTGIAAYPGTATNPNDFAYAHGGSPSLPVGCSPTSPSSVFDINPLNQETGGTPYVVLVGAKSPFRNDWPQQFGTDSMFINILISGMAGPGNYTYSMLLGNGPNPFNCQGLGANYNPINHLNDPIAACRSTWYAQVIPFIGMVVY